MTNLDGVFRREWGPAVAALARWSGDLTVAEDAVQEAFAEALRVWPRDGVPANAGGWIVTVARNRALDRLRRESGQAGKGTRRRARRHHAPAPTARACRTGPRRRTADDVHLRAPGAGPAVAAGADAAVDLRAHGRRDRAGAAAVRGGGRSANHPGQEQDSPGEHPAAGTAGRTAARADTPRARAASTRCSPRATGRRAAVGDPRRAVRRGGAAGRRAVRADARRPRRARTGGAGTPARLSTADPGRRRRRTAYRSTSRTAADGTAPASPAGWIGCGGPRVRPAHICRRR